MATITITPGESFDPTETVTSTKLNDLGSPTVALTTGSIVPTDLSTGAPSWDGSGTFNVIGSLSSSSIFTSGEAIEINQSGTGDRNAYVDFHTADPSGSDFNARIFRRPGVNGDFELENAGTGAIVVTSTIDQINSNTQSIATKAYVDTTTETTSNFTTEDGQSAGYQVFPSGLKMAWGDATAGHNGVITFPSGVGFTVAPTIQISYNKATNSGSYYGTQVGDVTTTNFVYKGTYANLYGPRYLAIGI